MRNLERSLHSPDTHPTTICACVAWLMWTVCFIPFVRAGDPLQPNIYSHGWEDGTYGEFNNWSNGPPDRLDLVENAAEAARGKWYSITRELSVEAQPHWTYRLNKQYPELYVRFALYPTESVVDAYKLIRFQALGGLNVGYINIERDYINWSFDNLGNPSQRQFGSDVKVDLNRWQWIEVYYDINPGGQMQARIWKDDVLILDEFSNSNNTEGKQLYVVFWMATFETQAGPQPSIFIRFDDIGISTQKMGIP